MWSGIAKAQSLKKVVDGGGQGVNGSDEVELTEGKFGQRGLEAVHANGKRFGIRHSRCMLKWKEQRWLLMEGSVERMACEEMVDIGMAVMEGSMERMQ